MFAIIPSPEWIVAFTAHGHLQAADIDLVMLRTEQAIAQHRTVHVFAEVGDPRGLIRAMKGHWTRDLRLLGKLNRFGRVAIVSPNRWLRVVARIESAVLPGIAYRVFSPSGRTEALSWVMLGQPDE